MLKLIALAVRVVTKDNFLTQGWPTLRVYDEKTRELMDPGLIEIANEGAAYSVMQYLEAVSRRSELGLLLPDTDAPKDTLPTTRTLFRHSPE